MALRLEAEISSATCSVADDLPQANPAFKIFWNRRIVRNSQNEIIKHFRRAVVGVFLWLTALRVLSSQFTFSYLSLINCRGWWISAAQFSGRSGANVSIVAKISCMAQDLLCRLLQSTQQVHETHEGRQACMHTYKHMMMIPKNFLSKRKRGMRTEREKNEIKDVILRIHFGSFFPSNVFPLGWKTLRIEIGVVQIDRGPWGSFFIDAQRIWS